MAVSAAGDLYVVDPYLDHIVKIPADGSPWVKVGSGFNQPRGVAVDKAGNVYVADTLNHRVMMVSGADGSQTQLRTGLGWVFDIVVDNNGYIYYVDNGVLFLTTSYGGGSGPLGYVSARGLGVDAAGNVYFFDRQQKIQKCNPFGTATDISFFISGLLGLTADGAGNVYYFGTNGVYMFPANTSGGVGVPISPSTNITALAVDPNGNVLFTQQNSAVIGRYTGATTLGPSRVCSQNAQNCGSSVVLNFTATGAASPHTADVITDGLLNASHDFKISNNTCAGVFQSGGNCTVTVAFTPTYAGLRRGALLIKDANGNVLADAPISGVGIAPQIAFGPGIQTTVASNLGQEAGLAIDSKFNLYIADVGNGRVVKQLPFGSPTIIDNSGLPHGLAINGEGDVFVNEYGVRVQKIPARGGPTSVVVSGLANAMQLTVDGAGNLLVADCGNNRVLKVPADGSAPSTVGSGFNRPRGVAVDATGNILVGDYGNSRVVKISPLGVQTILYSGAVWPGSIVVDAAGNVFFLDLFNWQIKEIPAQGGVPIVIANVSITLGTGDLVLDAAGNLYFASGSLVLEFRGPSELDYNATRVGSTSSDSPKSVTVINNGNAPLILTALTVGPSYQQVAGSGKLVDCAVNTSLMPGARCNLSISFAPATTGVITSDATLTDNSLNASPAAQTIVLYGSGQP
jgi:sugar lactone lactonase YvrE